MKGPIQDTAVHIKPSTALVDFLCGLKGDEPLPQNIRKIRQSQGIKDASNEVLSDYLPKEVLTDKQKEILKNHAVKTDFTEAFEQISKSTASLENGQDDDPIEDIGTEVIQGKSKLNKSTQSDAKTAEKEALLLNINDIRWIDKILKDQRKVVEFDTYLHELLADCEVVLPKNQIIPRDPVLEARCVKLREQQLHREYRNMTKDVDATRQHLPEDTISYQLKSINRQLVAVFQFVVSVICGFAFGFIGLELILGSLDFGFRLFMGVICALIIALAEIYFLAKKLNEYDEPLEDMPMPPRKAKPHQD